MMMALEEVMLSEQPDVVVVVGDTNSTLAGALVSTKIHIPVAHVEAGLRSFNRRMPEEINRILVDHASNLLLCPTRAAVGNLAMEGIRAGVHHVGDVMYDAALYARGAQSSTGVYERLGLAAASYAVATIHRAENTDDPHQLQRVLRYLQAVAADLPVVFPVHPRTTDALRRHAIGTEGLLTCDPLGYLDMAVLVAGAELVLTDSGGLQKEAYFARVPCVTIRDETEWVETVDAGWNRLWTGPDWSERREIADYGVGRAADFVATHIAEMLTG
jgi:UDP-GlcNAc3NAcA epimerase